MIHRKRELSTGRTHESFSREEKIVAGSDRSFGLVMAGALSAVSLLNAWHAGDTATLEQVLKADFGPYPAIYQSMLVTRNRNWAPKLEGMLGSGKQYFVVVGALHLVGPDGLLERFRKDGYKVEQL